MLPPDIIERYNFYKQKFHEKKLKSNQLVMAKEDGFYIYTLNEKIENIAYFINHYFLFFEPNYDFHDKDTIANRIWTAYDIRSKKVDHIEYQKICDLPTMDVFIYSDDLLKYMYKFSIKDD